MEPAKALLKHELILANISASDMQDSERIIPMRLFFPRSIRNLPRGNENTPQLLG